MWRSVSWQKGQDMSISTKAKNAPSGPPTAAGVKACHLQQGLGSPQMSDQAGCWGGGNQHPALYTEGLYDQFQTSKFSNADAVEITGLLVSTFHVKMPTNGMKKHFLLHGIESLSIHLG